MTGGGGTNSILPSMLFVFLFFFFLLKNINHTSLEDIEKLIDSIVDMENRKDYGHYISTMFDMVTSYIKAGRVDLAKEVIEETDKKLYHLPSDKILNIWNNQDIRDFAIGLRK